MKIYLLSFLIDQIYLSACLFTIQENINIIKK